MSKDPEELEQMAVRTVQIQTSLFKLVRIHDGLENVVFLEPIEKLIENVAALLDVGSQARFEVDGSLVFFNKRLVRSGSATMAQDFRSALKPFGLAGMWFIRNIEEPEVRRFLSILQTVAQDEGNEDPAAFIKAEVESYNLNAKLWALSEGDTTGLAEHEKVELDEKTYFPMAYTRLLILLREFIRHLGNPDLSRYFSQKLYRAAQEMANMVARYPHRFLALTTIQRPEEWPFTHLVNTALLSLLLGDKLGLRRNQLSDLTLAALLHSVGGFPRERLAKKIDVGLIPYRALRAFVESRQLSTKILAANQVAFQYPPRPPKTRKTYESRHPYARIVRIAEAYDSMTTARKNNPGKLPDEAVKVLQEKTKLFDPALVKAFLNVVGVMPTGTVVKLSTGEIGVVVHPNPGFPGRPLVAVARDREGNEADGRFLDLAEKNVQGRWRATIKGTLDWKDSGITPSDYLLG